MLAPKLVGGDARRGRRSHGENAKQKMIKLEPNRMRFEGSRLTIML